MEGGLKKIGVIGFSSFENGGVYQYTQSLIDGLILDRSNKYIIFTKEDDNRYDNYGLEVRKFHKARVSVLVKLFRLLCMLLKKRSSLFLTKEENSVFGDVDLFISPTISAYPYYYLKKPYIFALHDMQEKYYPAYFTIRERILRFVLNNAISNDASKIICESSFVKNDIVNFIGINERKICVLQSPPPAYFLSYVFVDKKFRVIKEKYSLPERFIFYPAQCWFHKNHIKLVEAFEIVSKEIDDVFLILTGSKQNNYNNLIKKIEELGLVGKVIHLGYVDYEDLPYFYKMSQFLVMPTLFESVSIPIYEAFALEVPVCSSNVVALPEQVGEAGLLFDPNDVHDISDKIFAYLKDENLRKEKAKLGLDKVKHFNHINYSKNIVEIITNI
jgi:glycosyltransferase involved in cell wall biosynthesis